MGTLIPNQPLIYERANGVVFARYRDPPYNMIERWVVGGEPKAVAEALGLNEKKKKEEAPKEIEEEIDIEAIETRKKNE